MSARVSVIVTCEHGGRRVPRAYAHLFRGRAELLESHRGFDPGALEMARHLSRALGCHLEFSTVTRLLVELNRSVGHPALFSEVTRSLDRATRADILSRFYHPHRERVEERIAALLEGGRTVVHVASHSFTPELHGHVRRADVAWLYDPRRPHESDFSRRWRNELKVLRPELRLRRNYPYRGRDDGITTHLRRRFADLPYIGVELEVNQRWFFGSQRDWLSLRRAIAASLEAAHDQHFSKR